MSTVVLFFTIILILKSFHTVTSIKARDYNHLVEYDTYCVLSVLIVRSAQLGLILYVVYKGWFLWFLCSKTIDDCTLRLRITRYARIPKTATISLLIVALWAESFVQKQLAQQAQPANPQLPQRIRIHDYSHIF